MKNKKKGFTLVELLVVIAIVAVLATVTVVGYFGFINKAYESNDISLTTQMNTILDANKAVEQNKTAHDAVEDLINGGLDVTKLTPSSKGYDYVWDSKQDKMFLIDGDNNVISPTDANISDSIYLFAFVGKAEELTKFSDFSVYLKDNYDATTITIATGIDTGNNELEVVNYYNDDSAQKVIIRTSGFETVLNVNGSSDVVSHYGKAKEINVFKVAMSSYHEYGNVKGNISLAQGNVEIENGAKISNIVVKELTYEDSTKTTVKVTPTTEKINYSVKENATVSAVVVDDTASSVVISNTQVPVVKPSEHQDAVAFNVESNTYITEWKSELLNGTTMLLKDLEDKVYNISTTENINATFDLNGHRFKTDNSKCNRSEGFLTFKDSVGDGLYYCAIDYIKQQQDFGVLTSTGKNAKLVIESGHIKAMDGSSNYSDDHGQYGLSILNGGTIIINGGIIEAGWYCVTGNGLDTTESNLIINGGKLISYRDYCIYAPNPMTTLINGGIIDGAGGAVCMQRGAMVINGGKLSSNGTGNTGTWGDGTGNTDKAVISIQGKYGASSLTINNCEFYVSGTAKTIDIGKEIKYTYTIYVLGGNYNFDIGEAGFVKEGYHVVNNGDGTYNVVSD